MPHTEPLVSIVIPVYNRESLILETLRSAQNQTYPNLEIVIVDNKSTDNTWSLLISEAEKDQRIRLFQNESNVGPVRNWEKCFNYAKGEYIKILWSDDLIEATFVEETMAVFEEDVAFVMTGIKIFSDQSSISQSSFHSRSSYSTNEYLNDILTKNTYDFPVSPGCAIFRSKDLINNLFINIPNEDNLDFSNYGAGNDLLLFLLTASENSYTKIMCINKYLSHFRSHDNSITITKAKTIKLYYDWSKWYFIKYHYKSKKIRRIFKSIMFLCYRNNRTTKLYSKINSNLSIPFLLDRVRIKYLNQKF